MGAYRGQWSAQHGVLLLIANASSQLTPRETHGDTTNLTAPPVRDRGRPMLAPLSRQTPANTIEANQLRPQLRYATDAPCQAESRAASCSRPPPPLSARSTRLPNIFAAPRGCEGSAVPEEARSYAAYNAPRSWVALPILRIPAPCAQQPPSCPSSVSKQEKIQHIGKPNGENPATARPVALRGLQDADRSPARASFETANCEASITKFESKSCAGDLSHARIKIDHGPIPPLLGLDAGNSPPLSTMSVGGPTTSRARTRLKFGM